MKNALARSLLSSALMIMPVSVFAADIIQDGGFEEKQLPSQLSLANIPEGKSATNYWTLSTKVKASGKQSLKFELDGAGVHYWKEHGNPSYPEHVGLEYELYNQRADLQGKKIRAEGKVFMEKGSPRIHFYVVYIPAGGGSATPVIDTFVEPKNGEWVTMSGQGMLPDKVDGLKFRVDTKAAPMTVYFDDFEIETVK